MSGQDSLQKHPLFRRWTWKYKVDHSDQCLCLSWHTPWGSWAFWRRKLREFKEKSIFCAWHYRYEFCFLPPFHSSLQNMLISIEFCFSGQAFFLFKHHNVTHQVINIASSSCWSKWCSLSLYAILSWHYLLCFIVFSLVAPSPNSIILIA